MTFDGKEIIEIRIGTPEPIEGMNLDYHQDKLTLRGAFHDGILYIREFIYG